MKIHKTEKDRNQEIKKELLGILQQHCQKQRQRKGGGDHERTLECDHDQGQIISQGAVGMVVVLQLIQFLQHVSAWWSHIVRCEFD